MSASENPFLIKAIYVSCSYFQFKSRSDPVLSLNSKYIRVLRVTMEIYKSWGDYLTRSIYGLLRCQWVVGDLDYFPVADRYVFYGV